MAPYHSWMDDPKEMLTHISWRETSAIEKIKFFMKYRIWFHHTSDYYYNMNHDVSEISKTITEMKNSGFGFIIHRIAEQDGSVFTKFLAKDTVDITSLVIMT